MNQKKKRNLYDAFKKDSNNDCDSKCNDENKSASHYLDQGEGEEESIWYDCLATASDGGIAISGAWTSGNVFVEVIDYGIISINFHHYYTGSYTGDEVIL